MKKTNYGRRWTDQEIFDAFNKWAKEHGRPPSFRDWQHASADHPTSMTVRARFGRWGAALEMLGFTPNPSGGRDRRKPKREDALKKRARAMRKQGAENAEIAVTVGVSYSTIVRWLGPKPRPKGRPRTAAARREARIAALREALKKES